MVDWQPSVTRTTSERYLFWTSGRAAQYAVGPLSASQLVPDRPYTTSGRADIAGRNYGLVDTLNGNMNYDPWGAIERACNMTGCPFLVAFADVLPRLVPRTAREVFHRAWCTA